MKLSLRAIVSSFWLMLFSSVLYASEIVSPDGSVALTVDLKDGRPFYRVDLNGKLLLEDSPLGLVSSKGDLSQGLTLVEASDVEQVRRQYDLANGKQSRVDKTFQQGTFTFQNTKGQRLSVLFEVADDGIAFAYRLHGKADEQVVVESEATGFAFAPTTRSFLHPMHVAKTGWSKTFPSYEAHYRIDRVVGEPSPYKVGWCLPALFHAPNVGWALVSETGVDNRYCGSHLAHKSTNGLYRIAYPQAAENLPSQPASPTAAGDAQLPWRTIALGETLAPIVQSTLTTDLVKPEYPIAERPTPGKAVWSWLFLKDEHTVFATQQRFIDMAAELGLEYILIDALWDAQIGREKTAELVDYARTKNVQVLLWYNSNPSEGRTWNDAPQSPKGQMHTPEVRREEMAWMKRIGVAGIKVDFFGGDKQANMQLYEDILRDAARYGLSVNFHGTTVPRGWERMFPNFMTNEAVRGMEFVTFEQAHADLQPQHCCMLPFTRNVIGPMDFTPVILSRRLGPNNNAPVRRTTDGFELALLTLFQSGIQHLGVTPEQVAAQSQAVRDYLSAVPTTWDETRLIDGFPGDFVVLARRSGQRWYVAAINGHDQPRKLDLALSFAGQGAWEVLQDSGGRVEQTTVVPAGKEARVLLELLPHGGAVLTK